MSFIEMSLSVVKSVHVPLKFVRNNYCLSLSSTNSQSLTMSFSLTDQVDLLFFFLFFAFLPDERFIM